MNKAVDPDIMGMDGEDMVDEIMMLRALSLRDWLAGMALQGILSYEGQWTKGNKEGQDGHVKVAYQYADAMLAERSKPK